MMKNRTAAAVVIAIVSLSIASFRRAPAHAGFKSPNSNSFCGSTQISPAGAQLEHQPTPASVERAKRHARSEIEAALGQARALDAQGKDEECAAEIAKAKLLLNP
jgi:hypothetical protein